MGEIAHVDLDRLRAVAADFCTAADDVGALRLPAVQPGALPGSALDALAWSDMITGRLAVVVEGLTAWARAARESAEAFERADAGNGERFADDRSAPR